MSRALELLVIAVAGGAGAGLRYVLDRVIGTRGAGRFPLGILVVNVTGSLALGVLTGLGALVAPQLALVLGTGLLGGYTTFSAVSVDSVLLAERGRWRDAAADLLGTLVLSVAAAALGVGAGLWIASAVGGA
ncbi:fluoride efflux transporter FluC [Microbacterium flavescens]|uniref:fluoride efflux transporter FluC n=1 Tax=Microbacterium flavescens TaxID=69366 RepID=UPI001BDE6B31|nr:CrcB family protein [Microbacterium flavescens]BFF09467.1 fluoride efflux transporter CrcB [Microbacterium flavescens]